LELAAGVGFAFGNCPCDQAQPANANTDDK
jgi:hypothetical protein